MKDKHFVHQAGGIHVTCAALRASLLVVGLSKLVLKQGGYIWSFKRGQWDVIFIFKKKISKKLKLTSLIQVVLITMFS